MSYHLGASQTDKRLLHNANRSLRLGRWLKLEPTEIFQAEQVNQFGAPGFYNSTSIFQSGRIASALNSAITKPFTSGGYAPYLGYSWEQFEHYIEWDDDGWVIPPSNFYYRDYYRAAACRFRYTIPADALQGETAVGIMLEVNGNGHATGQTVMTSYLLQDGTNGVGSIYTDERIRALDSFAGFDFYFSGTPTSNANFATPDWWIWCNDGNAVNIAGGVPLLYSWPRVWFNDLSRTVFIPLRLNSQRIIDMMSSQYIYLTVRPRLSGNFTMDGQPNVFTGALNPNTQSVFNFFNNKTSRYAQFASNFFFTPELYIYAH